MTKGTKGSSKLNTMSELWLELDPNMKEEINRIINSNGNGSSLLRLLKVYELPEQLDFPTSLFDKFMTYYNDNGQDGIFCFRVCGGQCLNITLEDVLYLTGLPIKGKPIVPEKNKDFDAFRRVFGEVVERKTMTMPELKEICYDKSNSRTTDVRIKAILFFIINCMIVSDSKGPIATSYVQFVEKLDEVDSYAWGAALLSAVYEGLRRYKMGKGSVGFMWLVLVFFCCRFNLSDIFEIEFEFQVAPYTLASLVKELSKKIGGNHYAMERHNLGRKLGQLGTRLESTDVDIIWQPYTPELLPDHLHDQIRCCTFVGPLFCYEHVHYHRPHVVAAQFQALGDIDIDAAESELKPIKEKFNRGPHAIDFKKQYQRELQLWGDMDRRLVQMFRVPTATGATNDHQASTSDYTLHVSTRSPDSRLRTPDSSRRLVETRLRTPDSLRQDSPRQDSPRQDSAQPARQRRRRGLPDPVTIQNEGRIPKPKKTFTFPTGQLAKGRGRGRIQRY
ncbi:hypothetical protein BVRB_2g029410 [Beta vulgaris subsp. vulgaris]|nr:hypothetical protein BVRB_2g029410 [Beta vulgaris subsp. vulgaris]